MLHEDNTKETATSPVSSRLRLALADAEMTQEELARKVNVTVRTVSGWCSGNTEVRWTNLCRVAEVLGREPVWFYVLTDEVAV